MLEGLVRTPPPKNADPTVNRIRRNRADIGGQAPDGTSQTIMVTKVEGDNVTIEINHPLGGVPLNFDINILSVREATKEELDHGHTHEDGHSH